eukprot:scaffold148859_cov19-Tisochrysis_lutea.AAC.3
MPVASYGFGASLSVQVIHARWAMLGAAGCIAPEILGKAGVIPAETAVDWFRTGVIPPAGVYKDFWADPFTLFFIEVVAIQFAELKRLQDYKETGLYWGQKALGHAVHVESSLSTQAQDKLSSKRSKCLQPTF